MTDNGTGNRSLWREVTEQISDHVDLAALELRYETQQAFKHLFAAAVCFVLVLTGFIVLQAALIGALMRAGLTLGLAALLLSLVYFGLAGAGYWKFGRRDKRVGPLFLSTQKEIHETLRWIQKVFS